MKYDFNSVTDRRNTNSLKWNVNKNELPMWVADMDFKTAPEIIKAMEERVSHGIFGYSDITDEWYDAYINWWKNRHDIEYRKEDIIFSTGVIPTISSCVRKLTTPAENVLVMTPVYNIFYNCILNNGRNVLESSLIYESGEYKIDWYDLEVKLKDPQTTLMLLCNPHNPIGKIWDRKTLKKIGQLAYENGVIVLSDEIHCDITDPKENYTPFASCSDICAYNSIICISPTKAFNLAGLQTSAVVVRNSKLRHKVWRGINTDECGEPNAFAIQAAIAAFNYGGEWLDSLREYIFNNKQIVQNFIIENISKIKLIHSNATYLLWLDCSKITNNSKQLAEHIRKSTGLYLSDGMQYSNGEKFIRMNIACPKDTLYDGLERLKTSIELL